MLDFECKYNIWHKNDFCEISLSMGLILHVIYARLKIETKLEKNVMKKEYIEDRYVKIVTYYINNKTSFEFYSIIAVDMISQ